MKITIVGCGNMGLVYARAFLRYNIVSPSDLLLVEKNETRKNELRELNLGSVVTPADTAIKGSDIIIIAVKPQDFRELAPALSSVLGKDTILLSIMAGIKITVLRDLLGHEQIVRAMPNSPVEIGMGVTGFSANTGLSLEQIRKVENLLATTGRTVYFENEEMLDAVTALSGSGPAYFFYVVKSMVEAGMKMGMEEAVASMLVKQTMLGAFHLINNANKSLDELIRTVASKGGTTEAAFEVFNNNRVAENLASGILAAEIRAKQLSSGS
ncbi:MAG TPA: pyrroline-5-carboxylate reductase [Bacteroidia bacterium]|jgi:pyrroline-5-carboxylate reductase|nr:pyrroline-5-carboxylate reductase [Bacteroidia bacterium]